MKGLQQDVGQLKANVMNELKEMKFQSEVQEKETQMLFEHVGDIRDMLKKMNSER